MKPTPWIDTYCDCSACEVRTIQDHKSLLRGLRNAAGFGFVAGLILMAGCEKMAHAEIILTDKTAVLALIGEAEGESQTCKIAIAETIRKRGSLKGVYGVHAKRVLTHKYSSQVALLARAAWFDSRFTNYSKNADGWGNSKDLVKFKQCKWFQNCQIVAHIDGTYFWKRGAA